MFPVSCFDCSKTIGHYYIPLYSTLADSAKDSGPKDEVIKKFLDDNNIDRACCRIRLMCSVADQDMEKWMSQEFKISHQDIVDIML